MIELGVGYSMPMFNWWNDLSYQVVYSKTASVPKVETVKSDNKDDDIDIDAI